MPGATDKPMPKSATMPLTYRRDWETAGSLRARTAPLPATAPLVVQLQHEDGSIELCDLLLCQAVGGGANAQLLMRFQRRRVGIAKVKGIEAAELIRSHL
jgi:hypothetical protein